MTICIAHIRDSSGIFGAERVILTLAKNLPKKHFRFLLICLQRPEGGHAKLVQRAQQLGIQVETIPVRSKVDIKAISTLKRLLQNYQVAILHSHDFKSDFYGLLASSGLEVLRVSTAHGSTRDSIIKRSYLFFNEHLIYPRFDRVIAVSEELQQRLISIGIAPGKIVVIANGLDLELLSSETEHNDPPLAIPKDRKVFGLIGRLFPDKGHRFFLKALASVALKHPEIHGLIVGAGPEEGNILRCIAELNLQDRVLFAGARSNMQLVYAALDALVIPSLTEGLPYVLLEAMANKIPVAASAVGDIPLLIKDGETGYLLPPGDEKKLAQRMIDLLSCPDKNAFMVEKAHALFMASYSAAPMANATTTLYLSLVKKNQKEGHQLENQGI